uniref:Uncharacterized protein n=1 Tax=Cannabis sativa TaxID=3483 RepID=A0A803PIG8_CANSA
MMTSLMRPEKRKSDVVVTPIADSSKEAPKGVQEREEGRDRSVIRGFRHVFVPGEDFDFSILGRKSREMAEASAMSPTPTQGGGGSYGGG